jgi:hypothetical protein
MAMAPWVAKWEPILAEGQMLLPVPAKPQAPPLCRLSSARLRPMLSLPLTHSKDSQIRCELHKVLSTSFDRRVADSDSVRSNDSCI